MKIFYFLILSLFFFSCAENYEQHYKDFSEFNRATLRQKSWYPTLIATDCYDLEEIHNLGTNSSFGKFSYKFDKRIDSLLADRNLYEKMPQDSLNIFLARVTKPKTPNWFLSKTQMEGNDIYKNESRYLIKVNSKKAIYFIYSSE